MIKLHKIETPNFKLDGGAYFGVVPKIIWEKKYPANENNMCEASCRSLLVEDDDRLILFDTGIGGKENDHKFANFFVNYTENLEENLKKIGFLPSDITDVVLTHLHFDHCGGTSFLDAETQKYKPSFPNARHYISEKQWNTAMNPNYREKSSYQIEKYGFLENSDKLVLVKEITKLTDNIELRLFDGHTAGLMLPVVKTSKNTFFFTGDLIPAKASIPLAWISSYDVFPLTSIDEKRDILSEAIENNWILMFQHDYHNECCDLETTKRGIRGGNTMKCEKIFNE